MLEARTTDETGAADCADAEPPLGGGRGKRPVMIVLHQEHSTPGAIGQWLTCQGYSLDVRRPRFGCPLPSTLDGHEAVVIFGGPMSANDRDDFLRQEIGLIDVALKEERPFLGVCLGAQMLARHLGARVAFHPDSVAEIGYFPITPTDQGRRICDWPSHVYQWHREGFDVPAGATLLATGGEAFPNQAFAYGPAAVGLQFHSEITYHLVNRWTTRAAHRLELPGAQPRADHLADHLLHAPKVRGWLDGFLAKWVVGRLGVGVAVG
jgi:GMP synthase (glutamine-hydrolysing)